MAWEWLDGVGKWLAENVDVGDLINVGTAVGGGIINQNAVDKATQAQDESSKQALELQERMYNQSRQDLAPYRQTGDAANKRLSQLMGLDTFDRSGIADGLKQNYKALFSARPAETPAAAPSTVAPSSSTLTPDQVASISGYGQLPGWNEDTQTYQDGFGYIQGEAGRRAAENRALYAKTQDLVQKTYGSVRPDYTMGAQFAPLAYSLAAPFSREENEWTNQELVNAGLSPEDATYNRNKAISSLILGDIQGMQDQRFRSGYTQKKGFLRKISPALKALGTAAILGPGAASIVGAAGLTGLPATLAEKTLTTAGGRAFDG